MVKLFNVSQKAAAGFLVLSLSFSTVLISFTRGAEAKYSWSTTAEQSETLEQRIQPPEGFQRIPARQNSFASWLRGLPLKKKSSPVRLHNGSLKWNQFAHLHVIDIDVGKRDLQQCADAVMRLRAEYLYSRKRYGDIAFNYTNGKRIYYTRWAKDRSYKRFRKYMTNIFIYAGTYSLSKELPTVPVSDIKIGDIFIHGGFPGHAVIVADMVHNPATKEKRFLLVQSFMPAQEMHVLRNPANPTSPWYDANVGNMLITPEWTFKNVKLKRFRD
ncbi:MAG: DUF4846 domain-containing protein [Methyloligellaceae bacterium]